MVSWMAHFVLALHALWVLANLLLPLWALRRSLWRGIHLFMLALTLLFAFALGRCPLTDLENLLWRISGSSPYTQGFILHAFQRVVYWDIPPHWLTLGLIFWFLLWSFVYGFLWWRDRPPGRRASDPTPKRPHPL